MSFQIVIAQILYGVENVFLNSDLHRPYLKHAKLIRTLYSCEYAIFYAIMKLNYHENPQINNIFYLFGCPPEFCDLPVSVYSFYIPCWTQCVI